MFPQDIYYDERNFWKRNCKIILHFAVQLVCANNMPSDF